MVNHEKTANDPDAFFEELRDCDRRNYIMIASSKGSGEIENDQGIVSGHAYSLIDLYEFEHEGENVRLCKLRNPWGHKEWAGDWSDDSDKWTPELKERFNVTVADDGLFYMSWNDYLEMYKRTSVCVNHDLINYKHSYTFHQFAGNENQAFLKFILDQDIDCTQETFAVSIA